MSIDELIDGGLNTSVNDIFQVTIQDCFNNFETPHIVSDFLSPVTNKLGKASKSSKIKTFPDYLFVHFAKFSVGEDWIPRKLDLEILETEKKLDIEFLRALSRSKDQCFIPNMEQLNKLIELGCDEELSKKALEICNNDFENAIAWIFNPNSQKDNVEILDTPNESLIQSIMEFGFDRTQSIFALKKTNNSLERSVDYLFSHRDEHSTLLYSDSPNPKKTLTNGIGKYTLYSIISHIGQSTLSGHYVAHILKDDNWVLFNDEKVVKSKNPPFKLGYIYLYKRDSL